MDLLKWQLSEGVVNGIDQQLNIGSPEKTTAASQAAMSVLMSAMAKNSSQSSSGLSGLASALDRDHDGSILDDVIGLVSGQSRTSSSRTMNGTGILTHLLGQRQDNAVQLLTKMTGLDEGKSMALLIKLAPMVLGVLGRYKRQNNLNEHQLSNFLSGSQQNFIKQDRKRSVFEQILDQDGDGSVMDEAAGLGMKLLGGLFRKS